MRAHCRPHTPATLRSSLLSVDCDNAGGFTWAWRYGFGNVEKVSFEGMEVKVILNIIRNNGDIITNISYKI
ncbi:MAG: hypothetical protein Q4D53_08445, partial [Leptotrichiaceae bacterium]|nr:hypothetical protein [Leptotrichiaceae bacterium]